jgi:hypothetical protein
MSAGIEHEAQRHLREQLARVLCVAMIVYRSLH